MLIANAGYTGGAHVTVSPDDVQNGISVTLTCGVLDIPAAGDRLSKAFAISSFDFSTHGGDYKCSFFNSTTSVTEFSPPVPVCRNASKSHCMDKAECATALCPHKCAYGYTKPPSCENPCPANKFGMDCTQTCHCLDPLEVCDAVQGVCPSHQCHEDWEGTGCSQRLPKLHDGPSVISSTCTSITVSWDAWDSRHDFGDFPSVWAYSLLTLSDESPNHSQWTLVDTLKHDALKKMYTHTVPVNTIARGVMHRFRVDIFYNASGKMAARSSPGFSSVPVYPCDLPASLSADTPGQVQRGQTVAELRHLVLNMEEVKVKWTLSANLGASPPADLRLVYVYRKQRRGICPPLSPPDSYIRFDMVAGTRGLLLHHLLPGYDYEYIFTVESATVTAIKETLNGEFSTKPNAPTSTIDGLSLLNVSATEVTVGWVAPPCEELGGPVSRYEVELSSLQMPTNISFSDSLQPSTRYEIRVRYANDIAPGPFSAPIIFETPSDVPPAPSPPLRVRQIFRELHCVGLSWDPGPENEEKVISFEIFNLAIANTSKNLKGHWSAPAAARQTRVCGLQPGREYSLGVAARGQLALSLTTKVVVFTDHYAPPPPSPLVVRHTPKRFPFPSRREFCERKNRSLHGSRSQSRELHHHRRNHYFTNLVQHLTTNLVQHHATHEQRHFTDLVQHLLQTLYNTTPHDMYNATSQNLYNTSNILYNNTVQTLYSPTPHVTKVLRSEPVSGQAAGDAGGTHSLATVSMLDVESLETWSRSQANVPVLALKLQRNLRTGAHLQTHARSTKRSHLVGLNIMTTYLELQSDSISRFLTGRGMLNFQGASRRQTVLRTALRAHKARSSSGSNGRSRQDQAGVFRTLVAARRTAGVALTSARRRRQSEVLWNTSQPPGREYMKLEPSEVHDEILVIIGTGDVVGGVYNEPLDPSGRYDLYLVSCSVWVSVTKCSASTKSTVHMPNEPFKSGKMGTDWRTANIIAVVVSVLLALAVAVTVLCLRIFNKTPRWYLRRKICRLPRPTSLLRWPRSLASRDTGAISPSWTRSVILSRAENCFQLTSLPTYFSGTGYHSIYINYSPSGMLSEANGMRPNNNSSLGTFINARLRAEEALHRSPKSLQRGERPRLLAPHLPGAGAYRGPVVQRRGGRQHAIRHVKQQTSFADFSEYMLALSLHRGERRGGVKGGEEHQVRLLVFTSWYEPQLSRDPHPLLELQRRLGTQREPYNETLLVHCENGCGRTAVFIALDILMATYASKREFLYVHIPTSVDVRKVSVYEVVSGMRRERPYMVHTFVQYLLIYIALFEDKHAGNTFLDLQLPTFYHDLLRKQPITKRTVLYDQFQLLSLVTEAYVPPPKVESSAPQVEQPQELHLGRGDEEVKRLRPEGPKVEDSV
ncbi:hypothetical protein C0Q70_04924 [Pomacea canaliculata]|uniref:Uncharacterized protein n=1 Tax=Pomacea canaliculata TaxID=400727 RepID=A0A2T7PJQ4_POMCA|nr:hypothetical protein C0Q70_04924 [Pomacea canaliculata]